MAKTAIDHSEYDQEIIDDRLHLCDGDDVPDELREQLIDLSKDFCVEIDSTMAPISRSVARWEKQNKEAITIIKRLESELET